MADLRRRITAPVLFVFSTRDTLAGPVEAARAQVSDLPGGSVAAVQAGHLMSLERPHDINRLILDFAAGHAR